MWCETCNDTGVVSPLIIHNPARREHIMRAGQHPCLDCSDVNNSKDNTSDAV